MDKPLADCRVMGTHRRCCSRKRSFLKKKIRQNVKRKGRDVPIAIHIVHIVMVCVLGYSAVEVSPSQNILGIVGAYHSILLVLYGFECDPREKVVVEEMGQEM